MKLRFLVRTAVAVACTMLAVPLAAFGQGVTTAAINGTVQGQDGQPLANVNIVAVHVPTGTRYGTLTRQDGRFNIPGMRVGGPYTVTASLIGYQTETAPPFSLSLGQNRGIQFTMVVEAVQVEALNVVAERGAILSGSRNGPQRNVSTEEIETLPTISRSISDFVRLTPQATSVSGGSSIAGRNNRFNNIQVDGAILNDVFGLPGSGTPGGQAGSEPISLDAIQEFQVALAPYDVREGGFTGGSINIITRSGTNQWDGSGYYFGRGTGFVGRLNDQKIGSFDEFQSGGRIGGPIARNKAFFFFSGEVKQNSQPIDLGLFGSSRPNVIDVTATQIDSVESFSRSVYGYDPGGFTESLGRDQNDFKIFGRLDFNLSDAHHLTIRHNHVTANADRGITRSNREVGLGSQGYVFAARSNSTVLQLDSRLGNSTANMFRFAYQRQRDKRSPDFAPFPEVEIFAAGSDEIVFGVERFSQANALDQDVFEITDDLTFFKGNHAITVGTHNEFFDFSNLFIQDFFGQWQFSSIEDYANGIASRYRASISKLPNDPKPRAEWNAMQLGFYAQDSWDVSPQVKLTFGLRADVAVLPDNPLENPDFAAAFPGRRTSSVPSGNVMWSPRFGFNAALDEDRQTQVRGGIGIFTGRNPFVWLSNQYSNTGVDFIRIDCRASRGCAVPQFTGDPFNLPQSGGVASTTEVDLTDTDFKFPQLLRTSLAIDHELTPGLVGTVEGIYSNGINDVIFKDISLVPESTASDGRIIFSNQAVADEFSPGVFLLDNTSAGYQYQVTGQLKKQLGQGFLPHFYGSIAYTYSQAFDVNSGTSSRSISNFQFNEIGVDPNNPGSAHSDFEVRNRIVASASYRADWGDGWNTAFTWFYAGQSGRPFNYIYFGDANNDGRRFNDLIFVPGSEGDAIFDTSCSSCQPFSVWNTFVNSDDGLKGARGKIVGRNTSRQPWINELDLRVTQQIPTITKNGIELTFDFLNVLNLLNSDWGHQKFVNFGSQTILSFRGYDSATGKPKVQFRQRDSNGDGKITRDDIFQTDNIRSRWAIQLGARYRFKGL
ncbi:MAG: carboxypeptidase regulatory-like domain-containing protein [Gemmatimonadota bacterium]